VLLQDAVKAAQRSLDIATLQYQEGLTDFERVLDSQRVFFSQQELLVNSRGSLVQNLIAVYKALGGGWEQGRSRPVLDDATRDTMTRRSDWKGLLARRCLHPAPTCLSSLPEQQDHDPRIRQARPDAGPIAPTAATTASAGQGITRGRDHRAGADHCEPRLVFRGGSPDPVHLQARVQAFVVPVAAEVSGKVLKVHVRNNDNVQPGSRFHHRSAAVPDRAAAQPIGLRVGAPFGQFRDADDRRGQGGTAGGQGQSHQRRAGRDAPGTDLREDSGAISLRRVERARANRSVAVSQEVAAAADLRKAIETAGERSDKNAQLISARSAIEKAELDLKRTEVVAPSGGRVTDLRTDVGQFAQPGAPVMTLIAVHDLWISAEMTENNLGNIKPGDPVAIVLDVMPARC
jgi:biotin carboxyl carrier protein